MIKILLSKKVPSISGEQFITNSNKDLEVNIKFIVQEIIRSLNTTEWYKKVFLKEMNGIELYLLVPKNYDPESHSNENYYLKYSFSLIFGQIIINDGEDHIFYNDPNIIFEIIEEFMVYDFTNQKYDKEYYGEIMDEIHEIYIKTGMIEYFRNILSIRNGFHCPHCDIYMDQTSYESIAESNYDVDFNRNLVFMSCPFCNNQINSSIEISEMIHSYKMVSLYKNFYRNVYSESLKLQYFKHINKKYPDSELLKDGYYESLDDQTYRDLYGISKNEFIEVWNLFPAGVYTCMTPYKYFTWLEIKYKDGTTTLSPDARYRKTYDYLVANASRLIRKRKLKQIFY